MLIEVVADVSVARLGPGRPRTTPDAVVAARAYATGPARAHLRARGIEVMSPEKKDSSAARPPTFDAESYRRRNMVERSFALLQRWRALALPS